MKTSSHQPTPGKPESDNLLAVDGDGRKGLVYTELCILFLCFKATMLLL
jgi:hypothetical protein